MSQHDSDSDRKCQPQRSGSPGPFTLLLWGLPVSIITILLGSLLASLLIEYACIGFLWPEDGAAHSYQVMVAESRWLSECYTQSLLLSAPVETTNLWVHNTWQWLFIDSGFSGWLQSFRQNGQQGLGMIAGVFAERRRQHESTDNGAARGRSG